MQQLQSLWLMLIVLLWVQECNGNSFKISKIQCKSFNLSFSQFKKCEINHVGVARTELSVHVALLSEKPVDDVSVSLSFLKIAKAYRIIMLNETVDFCAFLNNPKSHKLIHITFAPMISASNVNHSCPFQHDIIVDRYIIDDNTLSAIPAPNGAYIFDLKVAAFKIWRAQVKVYGNKVDKL